MTEELFRLRQTLRELAHWNLDLPSVPNRLSDEVERMKRWLGEAGSSRPPKDRMREAVTAFRQLGVLRTLGEARLACFGSIERFSAAQPPLIEDAEAFPRLLAETDRFSAEPRAFRRCYRGLLHTYFKYDHDREPGNEVGGRNWQQLRAFLDRRVNKIHVDGTQPVWAPAIWEHRNLLTEDPLNRYGAAMLRGNSQEFEEARTALEIDPDSWVIRALVLAQVKAATQQVDQQFRQFVEPLLGVLQEYPLQRDEGLRRLLDRYAAMHEHPEHAGLREACIDAWGSPWMTVNDVRWQRVKPESRAMVIGWLNLELIRKFFDVLSEDRQADPRRVRFWEKYHDQIEEIYVAFGPNAASSRSPDLRQLRKDLGPHLLWLRGGGSANNAFIMRMGGYLFVEFGPKNNACFIFRGDRIPFRLRGEVTADSRGLKHPKNVDRLIHSDKSYETWEQQFESALGKLGIRSRVWTVREAPRTGSSRLEVEPVASRPYSRAALRRLAEDYGLQTKDMTQVGGRLWVYKAPKTGAIAEQLEAWGFRWAESKNAWYRGKSH